MPLTNTEKSRRHADRIAAIDADMDAAFADVDWQRRRRAEKSLVAWVNTYCVGLMLEESPPPKGEAVLGEMQSILTAHRNYQILMGRGSGKTAYVECATLYALATGLHKFCVVISNSAASA